jgi:hypothetical protein
MVAAGKGRRPVWLGTLVKAGGCKRGVGVDGFFRVIRSTQNPLPIPVDTPGSDDLIICGCAQTGRPRLLKCSGIPDVIEFSSPGTEEGWLRSTCSPRAAGKSR